MIAAKQDGRLIELFEALREQPRVAQALRDFSRALDAPVFLVPSGAAHGACPNKCLPASSFCRLLRTGTGKEIGACMASAELRCVRIPVVFQQQDFCDLHAGPVRTVGSSFDRKGRLHVWMQRVAGSEGKLLRETHAKCKDATAGGLQAIKSALGILVFWLTAELEALAKPGPSREPSAVGRAKEIAVRQLTEKLSTRAVARAVGLSVQHFCRQFKHATGLTFVEYVTELRIGQACKLLDDRSLRISEIAFDVGFQSLSRFNEAFRAHTGGSPSEWRAKH